MPVMPTKRLERLMFFQGGACFFCKSPLPKAEASIEHLFASAKGGGNNEENCVACCKSLNAIFGSMSLKDKFQVVLKQKGNFNCPTVAAAAGDAADAAIVKAKLPPVMLPQAAGTTSLAPDNFAFAVANLKKRGTSRPGTLKTLTGTITSIFQTGGAKTEITAIIQKLQSTGKVSVDGKGKVSYVL